MIPPVVDRELRAAGRHWTTYWMRVAAGLSMLVPLFLSLLLEMGPVFLTGGMGRMQAAGRMMLSVFHGVVTLFLALICPALTADALARERRDGTLGLLFLTPLKVRDIVLGKAGTQMFRALALWLAVLPFLAVPFLMGSVTPENLVRAVLVEFAALGVGLAAGLMATVRAVRWASAVALAFLWAALFYLLLGLMAGTIAFVGQPFVGTPPNLYPMGFQYLVAALRFAGVVLDPGDYFGVLGTLTGTMMGPGPSRALGPILSVAVGAVVVFGLSLMNGALWLRRQKQMDALGKGPQVDERRRGALAVGRRVRRCSTDNPVIWLHAVNGGSRYTRWWLALALVVVWIPLGHLISENGEGPTEFFGTLTVGGLVLMEALMSAGSYRQELEEGSLEILLVTPLRPASLITGQWFSVVARMAPLVVVGLVTPVLGGSIWHDTVGYQVGLGFMTVSTWLTLPLAGLRCAMRRLHPITGWVLTLAWGVGVPLVLGGFLTLWVTLMGLVSAGSSSGGPFFVMMFVLAQITVATWWGVMTEWDLRTRAYQLKPLQRVKR